MTSGETMESQEFIVLYTHQKMKKSKVWQDGILKVTHLGNKAILYDDKGKCLDSLFLKCLEVKPGDDLESDQYLITVEEVKGAGSTAVKPDVIKEAPESSSRRFVPSGCSRGRQPAGLKRKFTGFQGPRQVPQKMVIMENGESAASVAARKPGPVFLSSFCDASPLFSAAGKKDINSMPTDAESTVTYRNGERNGSALSFKINPETRCEENRFCYPVSSVNTHSYSSLTIEPTKRDSLASHCFGVSQNIRSKAQIAALLKSKSASVSEEARSEIVEHFPQGQPQGSCKIATKPKCLIEQEECAEVRTGGLRCPRQSESTTKNRSQWAVRSSSQSTPVHSTAGGNDLERKPMAQGDNMNLNLKDLLVQKRVQFFETCAGNGKMYDEDKRVVNNQSWDQEVKLEITSFCESNSLPVTRGSVQNDGLLSEPDIQENIKIPVNQNDQMCVKESVLTRENAQGIHLCGTPGQECEQTVSYLSGPEHLQTESSLSDSSRMPDAVTDMFSETNTDDERLTSVHEPMSDVTQPVLEVTFNINSFETSDTEEESQESNRISQDSECWVKETLVNDCSPGVQKRCEDGGCEEVGCEHLPLLPSIGGKATETCPIRETLSSQFCGQTCVGFDTGSWKVGTTGGEIEEVDSSCHSSSPCTGDAANEGADRSLQNVRINYDFASLPNKSKGINANLHVPHFLNMTTNQTPVNSVFSEQAQPQPFIMGSDLAKNDQVLPTTSGSGSSTQLLNASPSHSEEGIALDPSHPQVSKSLSCPLGRKHPISKDTAAHTPECEDVGGIISLPRDHTGVDAAGESRQPWTSPRDSSEPSGLVNNISLLKSLSEHSTALEGLEILKKKNTALKQEGALRTREPGGSPEAEKPWVSAASQARPMSPRPNQHPQQCSTPMMIKENEVEPGEPLQSLQVFSLGSEEERAFPAVIPKQIEREACAPKPVEFRGHQVKGSASSAMMVRAHSSRLQCRPLPGSVEYERCTTDTRVLAPELPRTGMQVDFPQVTSPEQKMSTLSPVSTFSLDSRDDDFVLEFFERPLRARTLPGQCVSSESNKNVKEVAVTSSGRHHELRALEKHRDVMKKFSSVEKKNFQRPPLVRRTQLPLVPGPPDLDATGRDRQEASGSPTSCLCDDAAVPSFSFGPEDQRETSLSKGSREVTPGHVALPHNVSSQSKWLKYQNTPQCNLTAPSRVGGKITDSFLVESISGMCFSDTGERQGRAVKESSADAVRLQLIEDTLRQQQPEFSSQGLVCRKQALSKPEEIPNVLGEPAGCKYSATGDSQGISGSELCFPSGQKIKSAYLPRRQTHVPAVFQSPAHYKQVFISCLIEHLNILLFGLAQRLQKALSEVDISFYTSSKGEKLKNVENKVPSCHHHQPAKLVMVKKEGPNKGRLFYTCDASKSDQCKFFKWLEEVTPGNLKQEESPPSMVLSDIKSIGLYLRSQNIPLYEECQLLVRKGFDFQRKQCGKLKKFTTVNPEFYNEPKSKLYLKLSRKESSPAYSKDDLWVVSKTLDFELDTFIACSAFFGPSSTNEVELLPLQGYFPSNWPTNTVVHALLVCNASTELTTLKNIEDHFNPATLPLTRSLLTMSSSTTVSNKRFDKRKFIPPAFSNMNTKLEVLSLGATLQVASELIQAHTLNKDQATALTQIAQMMASPDSAAEVSGPHTPVPPIAVIQGVFGAGKSHLLAVVILFFVQLFEKSEAPAVGSSRPWKLLVSSSTNVAVDRVLLGLLSLGFEKFVRVGSVRKIAKPVLPYSLHAGSENANEQLKELHALMKEDLTPVERVYVRKSIEQHKLGTNKTLLKQVRVVGVTCAACPFPCLNDLTFPVVVLDESSQITEPASLLPIARFGCEKLILVGDPKQLPPTIQGSEAAHESGLEQTLFDRLRLMGHKPVLLRTQYRCHPAISAVANDLFYDGNLTDGVSASERAPLLDWLPTLCFYNVQGVEQVERGNSFHNVAEAAFTLKLIQSLIANGVAGSVVGVITLYRSQMHKLRDSLEAVAFHQPDVRAVQVSTVDAFQGAEKEIIILSCVRTRQVGFIDSEKRMNVALTRGRRHLLIVGNLACLRKNRLWGRVIQHCEGRKDGLQHASQCEAQLNHLLTDYFEKQAKEKLKKKSEKDKSKDKSHLQKGMEEALTILDTEKSPKPDRHLLHLLSQILKLERHKLNSWECPIQSTNIKISHDFTRYSE